LSLLKQCWKNLIAISGLAHFPNKGSVLSHEEYTHIQMGYRFIIVHPYLVFCGIVDNSIIIIVFYTGVEITFVNCLTHWPEIND